MLMTLQYGQKKLSQDAGEMEKETHAPREEEEAEEARQIQIGRPDLPSA